MLTSSASADEAIALRGYAVFAQVFSVQECHRWATELETALAACSDDATALRRTNGALYGARNLLDVFPAARTLWQREPLVSPLQRLLGNDFGLVRGLFFD